MDRDQEKFIKKIAEELALASHQSKDKEVSGLFMDILNRLTELEHSLKTLISKSNAHDAVHLTLTSNMEKGFAKVDGKLDFQNGRVKTNEIRIAYAMGGLAVISMIAVPILAWALYTLVNIENTIDDKIIDRLSTYEFELVK